MEMLRDKLADKTDAPTLEAATAEKASQTDYEERVQDLAAKHAKDPKTLPASTDPVRSLKSTTTTSRRPPRLT